MLTLRIIFNFFFFARRTIKIHWTFFIVLFIRNKIVHGKTDHNKLYRLNGPTLFICCVLCIGYFFIFLAEMGDATDLTNRKQNKKNLPKLSKMVQMTVIVMTTSSVFIFLNDVFGSSSLLSEPDKLADGFVRCSVVLGNSIHYYYTRFYR